MNRLLNELFRCKTCHAHPFDVIEIPENADAETWPLCMVCGQPLPALESIEGEDQKREAS
jgi:hypothetical protein